MSKTYRFRVHGVKKNGDGRDKTFDRINHALRYLWRIKEAQEIYLDMIEINVEDKNSISESCPLFIKMGRTRGVHETYAKLPLNRPQMKKAGMGWRRLPSKWNDLD